MERDEIEKKIKERLLTLRVLWAGISFAIPIYLFVGYYFLNYVEFTFSMADQPPIIAHALILVGLATVTGGVAVSLGYIPIPKMEGETPDEVFGKLYTSLILSYALCESAGVFGLVVFMLFGAIDVLLIMCALALAGLLFGWPSRGKLINALNKAGLNTAGI